MKTLNHKFVDKIPEEIEEGILYVSIPYETAIHKCCCGCGSEVVTPISPTDWIITFDGESVTLDPSIGSWSLECRSHYFIRKNKVVWSSSYSQEEIKRVRKRDTEDKQDYFKDRQEVEEQPLIVNTEKTTEPIKRETGFLAWVKNLFNK
tara:strand:+ start:1174 stop:1620 length:447 start_codon:yes stop_codon:yes gene_type:complete